MKVALMLVAACRVRVNTQENVLLLRQLSCFSDVYRHNFRSNSESAETQEQATNTYIHEHVRDLLSRCCFFAPVECHPRPCAPLAPPPSSRRCFRWLTSW